MSESFGTRMRHRREQQQITLATIAEQTKIKVSHLEGLERDDLSYWPVGIFRRAFIRAYAQSIGLEPAVVLQEFLAVYPDPEDDASAPADLPVDGARGSAKPPTRLRFLVGSALGSLSRGRQESVVPQAGGIESPSEPERVAVAQPVLEPAPATVPPSVEPDFDAVARLCTELSRVDQRSEMAPLLAEAARILEASGLIIWVWHAQTGELRPVLAHGYSDNVLAQLPPVKRSSNNATAAAFRSAQPCVVEGSAHVSGALVVPLMTPGGCGGLLALELPNGREQSAVVRSIAIVLAAQVARWIRAERHAEMPDRRLA